MTDRNGHDRRTVLALLASLGGWAVGLAAGCSEPDAPAAADEVLALFRHRAAATAVGRAYLAATPEERDPARLRARLALASLPPAGAGDALRLRVRDDFRAGRVVSLGDWVLSRSEARLCALLALTSPEPAAP